VFGAVCLEFNGINTARRSQAYQVGGNLRVTFMVDADFGYNPGFS